MVCIEMDANSKLGSKFIKEDPHPISPNGNLLKGVIEQQGLRVVNSEEKSILDFFRKHVLTNIGLDNGQKEIKESDHNILILNLNLNKKEMISNREEIFNFKDKERIKKLHLAQSLQIFS